MIQFIIQNISSIFLISLKIDTLMTVTVTLNENLISVNFIKRMISSSSTAKEYEIIMIFTYINGRTEFVLAEKQNEFHFSSRESSLK